MGIGANAWRKESVGGRGSAQRCGSPGRWSFFPESAGGLARPVGFFGFSGAVYPEINKLVAEFSTLIFHRGKRLFIFVCVRKILNASRHLGHSRTLRGREEQQAVRRGAGVQQSQGANARGREREPDPLKLLQAGGLSPARIVGLPAQWKISPFQTA